MAGKTKVKGAAPTVKDAECPRCERLLSATTIMAKPERYGRKLRECYGWCEDCNAGYIVIQFEYGGKWITHEYRLYSYEGDKPKDYEGWHKVVDLPDAPLVVTGPGGEYDKSMSIEDIEVLLKKQAQQAMGIIQQLVNALLDGAGHLKKLKARRKND